MPRVAIKKKEYKIKDLAGWIVGKMHTKRLKQSELAGSINISQAALSIRLSNGKDLFSYGDLLTLFKELEATDEEILRLMKM